MKAQNRFCLIFRIVARERRMAVATSRTSSRTRMMPPVSLATSAPEPMAMPMGAVARAGAAVVPAAAAHGAPLPPRLQVADDVCLVCRQHLGDDLVDADLAGDGLGRAAVVAARGGELDACR